MRVHTSRVTVKHDADDQFAALVSLFITRPGVVGPDPTKHAFASNSLRVNGKVFAMVTSLGGITFKLPQGVVSAYVAAGQGKHFDANKGVPMKEWFTLAADSTLDPVELAETAYRFVGADS